MGIRKRSRKRGPANLYERNGIFYGRITADGKERRKSLETSDRAEAERRLEKFLADNSRYHGTIRRTYREAMELWIDAGQWKPKTVVTYGKLLATLEPLVGGLFWDQIDKAKLLELSEILRQPKPGRTKPAGVATVNRYLSVISSIAEHVKDLPGWPEVNPVRLLPVKPRKEKRQHYVRPPVEHFDAYFARMRGTFGKLSRLALLTGARLDELVQLKSVDARNGRLQLWDTKSGFRIIPVSGEAHKIVTDLLGKNTELLFTTRNGGPYRRVSEMWREIRVRAQKKAQDEGYRLGHLRFHDLRHEYAIRYLENGGSIYILQQLLGHSTIKQTEWYLRYLTPDQVAAVKK